MAKANKPLMRRQKGWIGFVRSYKKYVEEGNYDNINWGEGTSKPKSEERDVMGKIIQKW
jgi:hypothetical protein